MLGLAYGLRRFVTSDRGLEAGRALRIHSESAEDDLVICVCSVGFGSGLFFLRFQTMTATINSRSNAIEIIVRHRPLFLFPTIIPRLDAETWLHVGVDHPSWRK